MTFRLLRYGNEKPGRFVLSLFNSREDIFESYKRSRICIYLQKKTAEEAH